MLAIELAHYPAFFLGYLTPVHTHSLGPSDNSLDKTRKIHDDYIFDFVFDDGHIENIPANPCCIYQGR
jgi:hypothetical protein